MTSGITLNDFVLTADGIDRELTQLLLETASCCKEISIVASSAKLRGVVGYADSHNVHGERQIPLDVEANQILMSRLALSHTLGLFLSEEVEEVVETKHHKGGRYVFACDPFDGSSLAASAGTVGTIWGIHRVRGDSPCQSDFLRPGSELVAAGMAVYGSDRQFLFTIGNGVHQFVFDPYRLDWVLVNDRVRMPEQSVVTYAVNEANHLQWRQEFRKFINQTIKQSIFPASLRYCGSLVGDGLRVIAEGAAFFYPEDRKNPKGKLRYVYECAPLSFLVEQAGGVAITTGGRRILDIAPSDVHERSSLLMGHPTVMTRYLREVCGHRSY